MKLLKLTLDDLNKDDGKHPQSELAYLAPSLGSFYLHGITGHAQYVWSHAERGTIDFHLGELTYAGSTTLGPTEFFVYAVEEHTHDDHDDPEHGKHAHAKKQSGEEHDHEDDVTHILFAKSLSEADEGYRIFNYAHGESHLWAYDARQFPGHDESAT